jgi:hypothetical protein
VSLSEKATKTVSAHYVIVAGSAQSGTDFSPGSGTVSIKAGQTAATINVNVKADSIVESNESLTVTLSSGVNASISRVNGHGTILNDD